MLSKVKSNLLHIVIGLALIGIGVGLMGEHQYFIWPPILSDIGNDHGFDMVFIAIGFSMIVWAFSKSKNEEWDSVNLFLAVFFMSTLSIYQLVHWLHTGIDMPWISNSVLTIFIVILAWRGGIDELD